MKKAAKRMATLVLILACILAYIPKAHASWLPENVFLTQNVSGTCTLCSAAMMVRTTLYQHGNSNWAAVTENALRPNAWVESAGLKWYFSHKVGDTTVKVAHENVNGITEQALVKLLQAHPEGIVLYCGKVPHAVYLIRYQNGVFYCADTVKGFSGKQITLKASWLGAQYGSQAAILKNVTAYWYVEDYIQNGQSLACACNGQYAGTYVSTADTVQLRIRAGHGTGYEVLGSIPYGAEVTVLKASGQGQNDWAHIRYNGITGYASMGYLRKMGQMGTVTTDDLRIRTGAGTGYAVNGYLQQGTRVEILETKQVGAMLWGRIQKGWISMDYVELDAEAVATGTVTTNGLRIRAGAGTGYAVNGFLQQGTRVEILETKQVGAMLWGRISGGWISMDYVELDGDAVTVGTVNTDVLRIRSNAGTSALVVGYYCRGDRVEILQTKTVNGTPWGRTVSGWICLDYVT